VASQLPEITVVCRFRPGSDVVDPPELQDLLCGSSSFMLYCLLEHTTETDTRTESLTEPCRSLSEPILQLIGASLFVHRFFKPVVSFRRMLQEAVLYHKSRYSQNSNLEQRTRYMEHRRFPWLSRMAIVFTQVAATFKLHP